VRIALAKRSLPLAGELGGNGLNWNAPLHDNTDDRFQEATLEAEPPEVVVTTAEEKIETADETLVEVTTQDVTAEDVTAEVTEAVAADSEAEAAAPAPAVETDSDVAAAAPAVEVVDDSDAAAAAAGPAPTPALPLADDDLPLRLPVPEGPIIPSPLQ